MLWHVEDKRLATCIKTRYDLHIIVYTCTWTHEVYIYIYIYILYIYLYHNNIHSHTSSQKVYVWIHKPQLHCTL